jgi:hypothetical protein
LYGPNIRFTSAEQVRTKLTKAPSKDRFTIGVEVDDRRGFTSTFINQRKGGLKLAQTIHMLQGYNLMTLNADMTREQIIDALPESRNEPLGRLTELDNEWKISSGRVFLVVETKISLSKGTDSKTVIWIPYNTSILQSSIQRLIHVPGLRGNPERAYRTTGISSIFPGTFENYVASLINHWQIEKDARLNDLNQALQTLGLTELVEARQIDDVQVELRVGRLPSGVRGGLKDMVNVADVGFGVSQILPVLVALLVAEPGQMVYLEQPEIHLHPKAQVALAKVLADAAKRGVRVVAETHSDLLLLGIQTLVAEGYISAEEVILHWFSRRKNGATEITTAELDEAGAYGDWPEDFADVILGAQNRYIGAAEARLMPQ